MLVTNRLAVGRLLCLVGALVTLQSASAAIPDDLSTLSLESLMQLRVTVTGASKYEQKQSEVAAAVSVITRSEIKAFGWRTLAEALATLPGVHNTYNHVYDYVGVRAFGLPGTLTERLLVTINGNRVNDPNYDSSPLGHEFPLDIDLIEQIEFFPGPGGATYGHNAMLGVVNVVTRTGADVGGSELMLASKRLQGSKEGRLSWGKRFNNGLDVLVSTSGLRAQGVDRYFDFGAAGVSGVASGQDGERIEQFFARVSQGPWQLEWVQGSRRKDDPAALYFNDPLVPGQFERDTYSLANLQYEDSFMANSLKVTGRIFAGRLRYDGVSYYSGQGYAYPGLGQWRGAEWRLLSTAWANHKLVVGVDAQSNPRTEQAELGLLDSTQDSQVRKSGYRIGVYLQDEWRLNPELTATMGLRADRSKNSRTTMSPRLALIWQAAPPTTLKALYGRAHREPNFSERDYENIYEYAANPQLRGERLGNLEVVADHLVAADLSLRASVYRWTIHDMIVKGTDPATGLVQHQSGTGMLARGVEFSASKIWSGGIRLRSSVSVQQSAFFGTQVSRAPIYVLARLNLSSPLPWAGLRAAYELRFDDGRPSLNGVRVGSYSVSNLHLSTSSLAPGLELSLSVRNLFDKRYAHPAPEASWQNTLEQNRRELRLALVQRF